MIVKEEVIYKFISGSWDYPDIDVRSNDIIEVAYKDIDSKVKTTKGRFVEIIYSSSNINNKEELKTEDRLVLDTSKEFHSSETKILLTDIIYVEKSI